MKQHLLSLLLIFSLFAANLLYADPVNINTATAEQIAENLQGIGIKKAKLRTCPSWRTFICLYQKF